MQYRVLADNQKNIASRISDCYCASQSENR